MLWWIWIKSSTQLWYPHISLGTIKVDIIINCFLSTSKESTCQSEILKLSYHVHDWGRLIEGTYFCVWLYKEIEIIRELKKRYTNTWSIGICIGHKYL